MKTGIDCTLERYVILKLLDVFFYFFLKTVKIHEQVRQLKLTFFFFTFSKITLEYHNQLFYCVMFLVLGNLHMVEINYLILPYSKVRIIVVKDRTVRKILCIRCLMYNFSSFFSFLQKILNDISNVLSLLHISNVQQCWDPVSSRIFSYRVTSSDVSFAQGQLPVLVLQTAFGKVIQSWMWCNIPVVLAKGDRSQRTATN